MDIIIRLEEEKDYLAVEKLTRNAFYNENNYQTLGLCCTEHYMVYLLRKKDGIKELNLVAEFDGKVVGNIVFTNAYIQKSNNESLNVISFGPLSVEPAYQNKGIGSALVRHSVSKAKELGYGAIFIYGHPEYYPRFGFVEAKDYNVTTSDYKNFPAFMAMELQKDYLKGISGKLILSDIYDDEIIREQAKEFDKKF